MKVNTCEHPKMYRLAELLGVEHVAAVGIVECMWGWAQRYCLDGGIGRYNNKAIADGAHCPANIPCDDLIDALVESGWVDPLENGSRLYIHDWDQHCETFIHMKLARSLTTFSNGVIPNLSRFSEAEKLPIISAYRKKGIRVTTQKSVRTKRAHTVQVSAHEKRTALADALTHTNALTHADAEADTRARGTARQDSDSAGNSAARHQTQHGERRGTDAHTEPTAVGNVVQSVIPRGAEGIAVRREELLRETLHRVLLVTQEPHWQAWWRTMLQALWASDGGWVMLEDVVTHAERAKDPRLRKRYDIGVLDNPGAFLVGRVTEWCKAHGVRWPAFPERGKIIQNYWRKKNEQRMSASDSRTPTTYR